MDIIGGISAATEGLKLVNELRKIDKELDKADLKLRLVDLAEKLMDAKQALLAAQVHQHSLLREIAALEEKLDQKGRLRDERGMLFEIDEKGDKVGEPYCNFCHVKEDLLLRLRHIDATTGTMAHYLCDNCKTKITTGPSLPKPPPRSNRRSFFE